MKIKHKLGIIVLVAMIGFTMTACDDPPIDDDDDDLAEITLSGTITVTVNGNPVPFVEVNAHVADWSWRQDTGKIPADTPNAPWSIKVPAFSSPTQIRFEINGYETVNDVSRMFSIIVSNVITAHAQNVSDININMGNIVLNTISGTIDVSFKGAAVPSFTLQLIKRDNEGQVALGQAIIVPAGRTTGIPWAVNFQPLAAETDVFFRIYAYPGPVAFEGEGLFGLNPLDYNIKLHNQNVSDVHLPLGNVTASWTGWSQNNNQLSVGFSFAQDGATRVMVAGSPLTNSWNANIRYEDKTIPLLQGRYYKYTVELRTESGERSLRVNYFEDENLNGGTYINFDIFDINATARTFELVTNTAIPQTTMASLVFQVGDAAGDFYIRVISIQEIDPPPCQGCDNPVNNCICSPVVEICNVCKNPVADCTCGGPGDPVGWATQPAPFTPAGTVVWTLAAHAFGAIDAVTNEITGHLNGPLQKSGNAKFYSIANGLNVTDRPQDYAAPDMMFTGDWNLIAHYGVNPAANNYRITVRGNVIGTPPAEARMVISNRDTFGWLANQGVSGEGAAFELVWNLFDDFTDSGVRITTNQDNLMDFRINLIVVENMGSRDGNYHLGAELTWIPVEAPESLRGWSVAQTIRRKIADGSLMHFVLGLDAAAVQAAGGVGGIGIGFNSGATGFMLHNKAFPWYWDAYKSDGEWNNWISYDDLTASSESGGFGALVVDGIIYLQYDFIDHPSYDEFKDAMSEAAWAQFGIYSHEAWKDERSLPIASAFFR
jgi:hypothetical protein